VLLVLPSERRLEVSTALLGPVSIHLEGSAGQNGDRHNMVFRALIQYSNNFFYVYRCNMYMCICTCVCVYVCVYVCMYVNTSVYVYTYI
jgi:hypothetical protein